MKAYKDLLAIRQKEGVFQRSDPATKLEEGTPPVPKLDASLGPVIEASEISIDKTQVLGSGAYGTVYVGQVRSQAVAVKVLKNDLSPKVMESFKKEASLLSTLYSPNICLFMGACFEPGKMMLISELMENGDMDHLLTSDAELSCFSLMRMCRDAARGMCWLHERPLRPILHRDLKPANCLIDRDWNVKICDFGLSEILPSPTEPVRDAAGNIRGSPLWMAPEVLQGREFSTSADVYSFGVLLWQCLTRLRPWVNIRDLATLRQAVCVQHRRPAIPDTAPAKVKSLVEQCWHPDAAARPTFRVVLEQLESVLLELAIQDADARQFWGRCFAGKTFVSFKSFSQKMTHFLEDPQGLLSSGSSEHHSLSGSDDEVHQNLRDKALRALLCTGSEQVVHVETFGRVLQYLGPFISTPPFPDRIVTLLSKPWFHGSVDTRQAEESVLGRRNGTFLIRFSNRKPGTFTITRLENDAPVHQRIDRNSEGSFVCAGKAYSSLELLLEGEFANLGVSVSAPGSPYTKIFETQGKPFNYSEGAGVGADANISEGGK